MLNALCVMAVMGAILTVGPAWAETRIKCASTTSTENSGLFKYLLPIFEKKTGIHIDVVAVGTGAAIEIGKRGATLLSLSRCMIFGVMGLSPLRLRVVGIVAQLL